eukprot:Selendium_serpulae@DN2038_c0_g1_i2.p1
MNCESGASFSEACDRNKAPILEVLRSEFEQESITTVLEVGSGTGQHAVFFAKNLPNLSWQPSDVISNLTSLSERIAKSQVKNALTPIEINVDDWDKYVEVQNSWNATFSANTLHIMSWQEVQKFISKAAEVTESLFCVYGPFNYNGKFTSPSNEQFNNTLKSKAAHMGIRDFEKVDHAMSESGFVLKRDHSMPANNRLVVWKRNKFK